MNNNQIIEKYTDGLKAYIPIENAEQIIKEARNDTIIRCIDVLDKFTITVCLDCGAHNPDGEHSADHTFDKRIILRLKDLQKIADLKETTT